MTNERPCHGCRIAWKDCPGFPFYTAGDLQSYCSHQIRWLVLNFMATDREDKVVLITDRWPTEDVEGSGYSLGIRIQTGVRSCAGFEKPMQEAGQIHHRIAKTGRDGANLVQQVHLGRVWKDELHRDREFSSDAKTALLYCCGRRDRETPYRVWKSIWQSEHGVKLTKC